MILTGKSRASSPAEAEKKKTGVYVIKKFLGNNYHGNFFCGN
jgi:hypothetical protein